MRVMSTLALLTLVGTVAAVQAAELSVGDKAPDFKLAANGEKIRKYDVAYFMASVDPVEGEKGNKAFAESEKADFPMLSDPTRQVATAYGVLNADRGVANRWTFYIDKNGTIVAIDRAVKPPTSAEDMLAKLAELKVAAR